MDIDSEELRRLYVNEGKKMVELAAHFNCSRSTIRYQLIKNGVPLHEKLVIDRDSVQKLYESGISPERIAIDIGHSPAGVKLVLQELGVSIRGMKEAHTYRTETALGFTPTKEALQKLVADHGGNAALAAEACGVKYPTLYGWLRKLGVECNGVRTPKEASNFAKARTVLRIEKENVLQSFSKRVCEICGETRSFDMAHIQPNRDGGKMEKENILLLCPNHHDFFDKGRLTSKEFLLIKDRVRLAEKKYNFRLPFYLEW